LKTGLSQVWGLMLLSKQWGCGFTEIHAPEIADHVLKAEYIYWIDVAPHQGRSTNEILPAFEGTPPCSHLKGDLTDKSRVAPPVARQERVRKRALYGWENLHHWGAVQLPEWQDLYSNDPWGEGKGSKGAERPSPFYIMICLGCPIRGWHLFIFVRKGWKLVPRCIKRMCYKKLWNLLA